MNKFKILILFALSATTLNIWGQNEQKENKSPFTFGCDFVSRYIWRGVNLGGNTPAAQPAVTLHLGSDKHAFSLGTFGSFTTGGQQLQEADLLFSYAFKDMINLAVTDYFFPADDGTGASYFNYKDKQTTHVFEGAVSFKETDKIPFNVMFAMNFYGADARKINADSTIGNIMLSKYLEIGYTKKFSDMDLNLFVGAALDDPNVNKGETGFYGNKSYGIINAGCKLSKKIRITDKFSLPVQTQLIINPESERIFMVFGLSL